MSVNQAQKIADAKGITGKISKSTRKDKRFMITRDDKIIHFGSRDGQTFLDHNDDKKRSAWRKRHSKILSKGTFAYKNKESGSYYSYNILW